MRRSFRVSGNVVFRRLNLLEMPASGRVSLREGGYYTYAPKPGFRGSDRFLLEICGEQPGGSPACSKLDYNVTVR